MSRTPLSRRSLLLAAVGAPLLAACSDDEPSGQPPAPSSSSAAPSSAAPSPSASGATPSLAPTPSCDDGDDPTPEQTEGPYFTTGSPEKSDFRGDVTTGTPLTLVGSVVTTACAPVARAKLDFWHADDAGVYDNSGYRLRGHLFTDDAGRFALRTVQPGHYPGRTRHFHVKVQAPDGPVLTTQLYFPDEPANDSDGLHQPELDLAVRTTAAGLEASYLFVVDAVGGGAPADV